MPTARDRFEALIGATVENVAVVKDVSDPGPLDPAKRGLAQIIQTELTPAPTVGEAFIDFELWVFVVNQDPTSQLEDDLEGVVGDTLKALDTLTWCAWTKATRGTLNDLHGYKIALTAQLTL